MTIVTVRAIHDPIAKTYLLILRQNNPEALWEMFQNGTLIANVEEKVYKAWKLLEQLQHNGRREDEAMEIVNDVILGLYSNENEDGEELDEARWQQIQTLIEKQE